jgi:Fe2+ or Zn2+ uptake regulation protein
MSRNQNTVTEIQAEVLGYLDEHPEAADSIEAIQRWWLLQRIARYSRSLVQQALDGLVAAQRVERRVLGDGREVYTRARQTAVVN